MNVLLFVARPGGGEKELLRALTLFAPDGDLEAFSGIDSFIDRIRSPREPGSIAIIWNPANEDLRRIGSMKDLLRGGRTLLVLPDQAEETVALAHHLLPTFITYVDDGIFEVLSVLIKLAGSGPGRPATSSLP